MTFPSIPFLLVRGVLRAHWCCGRSAEQLCLLKPYQHRKPTCDFSFMNVNFTSWCGHGACSTSNIGPITVLENFYFEAEGMGGVAPAVICVAAHSSKLFCLGWWCNFTFFRVRPCHLEQSRRLSLTLRIATPTWKKPMLNIDVMVVKRAHKSLHNIVIFFSFFLSFSHVNEYPCIFKCEIYCRGILNFNCDAFNRTLCALIT